MPHTILMIGLLLIGLHYSQAELHPKFARWSSLPQLLTFAPPVSSGCTENILVRAWSDAHNSEAILAKLNTKETYRDEDDRLQWSVDVLEAPRADTVGFIKHEAVEVLSKERTAGPAAAYLATFFDTNSTSTKKYLHRPVHAMESSTVSVSDMAGVVRAKIVFGARIFPVAIYACAASAVTVGAQLLAEPVALGPPAIPGDAGADSCPKGILIYTAVRPWYSAFFRLLHAERADGIPSMDILRNESSKSLENIVFAADPLLLMDVVSMGSNARNDWCSFIGPTTLALVISVSALIVSSLCFCCPQRKAHSNCRCWDRLANKLPGFGESSDANVTRRDHDLQLVDSPKQPSDDSETIMIRDGPGDTVTAFRARFAQASSLHDFSPYEESEEAIRMRLQAKLLHQTVESPPVSFDLLAVPPTETPPSPDDLHTKAWVNSRRAHAAEAGEQALNGGIASDTTGDHELLDAEN